MSTDEFLFFPHDSVRLAFHEGAAGPDRHLFSVSLCKSSLTHLHASSLSQPFSVSRSKVSRVTFIFYGSVSMVA